MDWFERAKELKAQGYSYREIGEMLGKARQTVKNRFCQANKKLKRQGVDVDEWNEKSKGRKLPEKAKKKRK